MAVRMPLHADMYQTLRTVLQDFPDALEVLRHLLGVGNPDGAFIYWIKAKEMGGSSKVLDEKIKTGKLFK